jgi:hypothetical protein
MDRLRVNFGGRLQAVSNVQSGDASMPQLPVTMTSSIGTHMLEQVSIRCTHC